MQIEPVGSSVDTKIYTENKQNKTKAIKQYKDKISHDKINAITCG